VTGDLAKPILGISASTYEMLADHVDAILHNGAYVHWLLPFDQLRDTNIGGTREVFRFAVTKKLKSVHYVSTMAVLGSKELSKQSEVKEDDPLTSWKGLAGGYAQTKWVADKIAQLGRRRGIPTNIYRPGYVTGHSKTGVWNTDDFLCRLLKGCVQLGKAPEIDPTIPVDMSPVDYVSGAIVHLMLGLRANTTFHVIYPHQFTYYQLLNSLASFGYAVQFVPFTEWQASIATAPSSATTSVLSAVLSTFSERWDQHLRHPRYEHANTQRQIAQGACARIEDVLGIYFSYLIAAGFLQPPSSVNTNGNKVEGSVDLLTRTNRS